MLAGAAALAIEQRAGYRAHRVSPGADVPDRGHHHIRRTVGLPAHAGDAGVSGAERIETGLISKRAGLAECGDRAHDRARINRLNAVPTEAHAGDDAGSKVFNHHVNLGHQSLENRQAFFGFGIYAQALLAAIVLDIVAAAPIDLHRREPGLVAARGEFDLDDFGAHLGHHQGHRRSGDVLGEVQNLVAVENAPWHFTVHGNDPCPDACIAWPRANAMVRNVSRLTRLNGTGTRIADEGW